LTARHEVYDGNPNSVHCDLRAFIRRIFRNEFFGGGASTTAPHCKESLVDREGLPLRAVVCLSAYRKLKRLVQPVVLVATVDADIQVCKAASTAHGIDFDNARA